MKLLHIDSSILGGHSVSRQLSAAAVAALAEALPGLDVTYRDLDSAPLAHLSGGHIAAAQGHAPQTDDLREDLAIGHSDLADFLAADIVVIGAPMYNFTIPSQLKAWIDRILVAGRTFRYSAEGVEGLAGDKRVIIAISRGNYYGPGAPAAAAEHVETYLRTVFGFIGVKRLEVILAEGVQVGPDHRQKAVAGALESVAALAA